MNEVDLREKVYRDIFDPDGELNYEPAEEKPWTLKNDPLEKSE